MVEQAVNAGEQATNTTSNLRLSQEDQFRVVNKRLDKLTTDLNLIAKPPQFRLADVANLLAIVVGVIVALIAAFNLSERISDARTDQAASEVRIKDSMNALEVRLSNRLDKLSDQFTSMDERTSRLEGSEPSKKPR